MHRFVKWPKYVRIQRQRRVLNQRLKVPPSLNRFTRTLDKNMAEGVFKVLMKYRPEDKAAKKERLLKEAEARAAGGEADKKKPVVVKFGINHVTTLVEQGKAQLVVIAHDVDPIEIVIWLPALCKKMGVPYCIVKVRRGRGVRGGVGMCVDVCGGLWGVLGGCEDVGMCVGEGWRSGLPGMAAAAQSKVWGSRLRKVETVDWRPSLTSPPPPPHPTPHHTTPHHTTPHHTTPHHTTPTPTPTPRARRGWAQWCTRRRRRRCA